jgi:hypothetical protein
MAGFPIDPSDRQTVITATAGQTVLAGDFPILTIDEVTVKRGAAVLVAGVDYNVSGAGVETGFTVTLVTPATAGQVYTISGATTLGRSAEYPYGQAIPTVTLNNEMDRGVLRDQELRRDVDIIGGTVVASDEILAARDEAVAAANAADADAAAAQAAKTAAEAAQTAAASSASSASSSASSASADAATATTKASEAAASATTATTQAGNAATSATNAGNSATTAATAASDAANSYDSFDDRYLGPKAADPTLDNDGNPLLTGALYWNTGSAQFRVWTGSAWTVMGSGGGGSGDVTGPVSAVDGNIAIFSGTTGKIIADSGSAGGNLVSGSGAVSDNRLAVYSGTTGKLIKQAGFGIDANNKLITLASASGSTGLNLPQGVAPSAPANGDVWTTSADFFVRLNGATVSFARTVHIHVESDITNLVSDLAAKINIPASSARGDILYRDASAWNRLPAGTSGQKLKTQGAGADPIWVDDVIGIPFTIDGSGAVIATGNKRGLRIPFACTITEWAIGLDQSGSIVIDIWKDTQANYPPTVADTITASAKPTVSATTKNNSTTLTGWNVTVNAGDWLFFNVDSVISATWANITLTAKRT